MSCRLAIDTATAWTSVCLCTESGTIAERDSLGMGSHNASLSEMVSDALTALSVSPGDLTSILVGAGPGSFTGLRIGYSFAKGMAYGAKSSLSSFSTFDAWSLPHRERELVLTVLDAGRSELFCAAWSRGRKLWGPEIRAAASVWKESERLSRDMGGEVYCLGSGDFEGCPLELHAPERVAYNALQLAPSALTPSAISAAALADLTPQYLRAVSAKTIAERQLK